MQRLADRFADRLQELGKKVRPVGPGKYEAQSPIRDDRNPSLSISEGEDGRLLLYDHGGGSFEDILVAVGWTVADAMPQEGARANVHALPRTPRSWPTLDGAAEAMRQSVADKVGHPVENATVGYVRQYPKADGTEYAAVARYDFLGDKTVRPFHKVSGGWALGDPDGALANLSRTGNRQGRPGRV